MNPRILTLNDGSSSVRFAFHQVGRAVEPGLHGKIDRIGPGASTLTFEDPAADASGPRSVSIPGGSSATEFLLDWLQEQ